MATTGELNYKISSDASGLTTELAKAERSVKGLDGAQKKASKSAADIGKQTSGIDKLKNSFKGLGTIVGGLGIGLAFKKMVDATVRQESALAQLNQTLKSTEGAAGKTSAELVANAAALQQVTKFGDEAIIEMQSLVLTFKDIKGDQFDQTTEAVLDMATAMKTDLKSAAIQLGKALNDPARNLSALTRSGIQFTEAQTDMIKSMQKGGDMAGAQAIILKELESQFGGSAEAARDTLGGAIAGLTNTFGDLFEAESETSASMVAGIKGIEGALKSQAFKDGLALVTAALKAIFGWLKDMLDLLPKVGGAIASFIDWARTDLGLFRDDLDAAGDRLTETIELSTIAINNRYKPALKAAADATDDLVVAMEEEEKVLGTLSEVTVLSTRKTADMLPIYLAAEKQILAMKDATVEATEVQDPFADAMQDTVARIDTVFADAWRNIGDGAADLFDGLVDGLKQTLAEMAHLLITRPLVVSITGALGMGGAGSAAASAGGGLASAAGGGIFSALSSGIGTFGADFYKSIGRFANDVGLTGIGDAATWKGMNTTAGTMGLDLGGGILGGWAGNQVFGSQSGIGAGLGGVAGSALIPIPGVGAGIGAFLGTGLEKALGDVFGFGGKPGNNIGYADLQGGSGGYGNYNEDNETAAQAIVDALTSIADPFGVDLAGRVEVSDRGWAKYDGEKYTDTEDLVAVIVDEVLASTELLNESLRGLALSFEGTTEETLAFAMAIMSLDSASGINSVTQAIEDFSTELPSLQTQFVDNTVALGAMVAEFDGSAESAVELNNALLMNKQAAYDFAIAILSIGAAIAETAATQAQNIRESVMSQEELNASRLAEREVLEAVLDNSLDPEVIADTSARLLELNQQIFNDLTEDQKALAAEDFATYAEEIALISAGQLDIALASMETVQGELNNMVSTMLTDAANKQQAAADTQVAAANNFAAWARRLLVDGIDVNVQGGGNTQSNEVAF